MDEMGFRGFIRAGRGVPSGLDEVTIRAHVQAVKAFERFLQGNGAANGFEGASESEVDEYVSELASNGSLRTDTLMGLLRYSRFCRNNAVNAALLVWLDSGLLQALSESFEEKFGHEAHGKVLGGFEAPPLGTPTRSMPRPTIEFMSRLESGIGIDGTRRFLVDYCPHTSPIEHYSGERELFLASEDVDGYLAKRRQLFIEELEGHMKEGTLYYNQEIDAEVIEYVMRNPEVGSGVRRGNAIYHTKIPYMAIEYLRDKDDKMRRYHYCHCPLARESILSGEKVSHNLCYCSGGHCKRPFEAAFARPLKVDVKKTALWGDEVCQFTVELPKELLPNP